MNPRPFVDKRRKSRTAGMDFARCRAGQKGGGLLRSATYVALSTRSSRLRRARSVARVRCRLGIIRPRLVDWVAGGRRGGGWPVVVFQAGKKIRLPGRVLYVLPVGAVQTTVPRGNGYGRWPLITARGDSSSRVRRRGVGDHGQLTAQ